MARTSQVPEKIAEIMRAARGQDWTVAEVVDALRERGDQTSSKTVRQWLARMAKASRIRRAATYRVVKTADGRDQNQAMWVYRAR